MSDQDKQNRNQPDRTKIDRLLQKIENASKEEKEIIAKEVEPEIF